MRRLLLFIFTPATSWLPRRRARRAALPAPRAIEYEIESEEVAETRAWRQSVTSADFDDALVYRPAPEIDGCGAESARASRGAYSCPAEEINGRARPTPETRRYRLFRRQFEILLPGFAPKRQLAVSARRGRASLRRLQLNATAVNRLQLTRAACDALSIAWTSVFTLNRDPLEVRIQRAELDFDQGLPLPSARQLKDAALEWAQFLPPPAPFMREYPTVEGARFLVDDLVCVARRVETPFARGANATVRLTLRGVDARSVDNTSQIADLRRCWASHNPRSQAPYAYIAKRILAKEAILEVRFEEAENVRREADLRAAAAAVAEAEAAAAAARAALLGEEEEPVLDMDPLRLLRRPRRHEKADRGPRMSRSDAHLAAAVSAKPEKPAAPPSNRFETIARAPLPAALLTLGYDSPTAEVASVRLDLDLRRFNLSLSPDTLREPRPAADDVALGVFALLGETRPGAPVVRPEAAARKPLAGRLVSGFTNAVLRPALAAAILLWGLRII